MRPRFQVVLPLLLLVSTLASAQNFTFKDTDYPVGPDPLSIKSGDLIGDGKSDLVIVNSASNTCLGPVTALSKPGPTSL